MKLLKGLKLRRQINKLLRILYFELKALADKCKKKKKEKPAPKVTYFYWCKNSEKTFIEKEKLVDSELILVATMEIPSRDNSNTFCYSVLYEDVNNIPEKVQSEINEMLVVSGF